MSIHLQRDVWAMNRCSGCGACVAACSKGVLYWNEEEHPMLEVREKTIGLSRLPLRACEVCEVFCEQACPVLVEWVPLPISHSFSARSEGVVKSGELNDVLNALLISANSADLIDGVVMLDLDPWTLTPKAKVFTSVADLVSTSGVQYLWAPVLDALNEAVYEYGLTRIAVVGYPCVAQAVRRLINTDHPRLIHYKDALSMVISTFCTGTYHPRIIEELLERGKGISRSSIRRIASSTHDQSLIVSLWDNTEQKISFSEIAAYTRHGCGHCDDFLGNQADISLGALGSKDDRTTLLVRTPQGERLVQNAILSGLLEVKEGVDEQALKNAQEQKSRRARAEAFDEFQILMLDALGEPKKRAVIRNQFVKLYGGSQVKSSKREKADVACGGC